MRSAGRHTMSRPSRIRSGTISNDAIVGTALAGVLALLLLIGGALLWTQVSRRWINPPEEPNVEPDPRSKLTIFPEGYAIALPPGFEKESREVTDQGDVVYRYISHDRYRFTLAIINDPQLGAFPQPPSQYADAIAEEIPGLNHHIDGEVQSERVSVDGMAATTFRFCEKETFRGVTFYYVMVAMERGQKLLMQFSGRYGGYSERDPNIQWPDHWQDSLLSFQHDRPSS